MIKKLLISSFIIGAVGATGINATRALLTSNQVVLAANDFATGSVNLQISKDGDPVWHDDTVPGFSGQLRPGETKSYYLWLKNGTTDVGLKLAGQVPTPTVTGGVTASDVKLKFTPVDGSGNPTGASSTVHTLSVFASPQGFPTSGVLPANAEQRYKMDVTMDDGVDIPGTVTFSVIFTGTQVTPTPTPTP